MADEQPNERLLPCDRLAVFLEQYRHCHGSSTIVPGLRLDDLRYALDALRRTRVPAVQDEGMVAKVKDAIRGAASRLPGMTLDDELSDREVTNAAKAAIQAMSLYGENK